MGKHEMKKKRYRWRRVCTALILAVVMTAGTVLPVSAGITSSTTSRAINEYADWIEMVVKNYKGQNRLPGAPLKTYGKVNQFKTVLRKYIGDGKYSNKLRGVNIGFSSSVESIKFIWSVIYKNDPYVEYESTGGFVGGRWYAKITDTRKNYVKYQHDVKNLGAAAIAKYRADFRRQLTAYQNKYGKMTVARKLAAAVNYCSEKLSYREGAIRKNGKLYYAGGDLYSAYMTGYGICFDYSTLFRELCRDIGVECHLVMGRVKFSSYDSWGYHQWNVVRLRNKYFYVDPTNDDMGKNTGINNYYNCFYPNMSSLFYGYNVYIVI